MKDLIEFRPMTKEDIPFYYKWAEASHVKRSWFTENDSPKEKILEYLKSDSFVKPFIISVDSKPIGYIQYYDVSEDKEFWGNEPKGTYGVDIFIGEVDYLGKGYVQEITQKGCKFMFENVEGATRIVIDPYITKTNKKAVIYYYGKIGFVPVEEREQDGKKVLIMERLK